MVKFVRDSQLVWPYCSECGCRLNVLPWGSETMLTHFWGKHTIVGNGEINEITLISDARGCKCSKLIDWDLVSTDKIYIGV